MSIKKTKKEENEIIKKRARDLFKFGLTTREIGKIVGRSHAWVALVVKKKDGVNNSCLTKN